MPSKSVKRKTPMSVSAASCSSDSDGTCKSAVAANATEEAGDTTTNNNTETDRATMASEQASQSAASSTAARPASGSTSTAAGATTEAAATAAAAKRKRSMPAAAEQHRHQNQHKQHRDALHASMASSAHGFFAWLSAQQNHSNQHQSSDGSNDDGSGLMHAGRGGKVVAALEEEFPELMLRQNRDKHLAFTGDEGRSSSSGFESGGLSEQEHSGALAFGIPPYPYMYPPPPHHGYYPYPNPYPYPPPPYAGAPLPPHQGQITIASWPPPPQPTPPPPDPHSHFAAPAPAVWHALAQAHPGAGATTVTISSKAATDTLTEIPTTSRLSKRQRKLRQTVNRSAVDGVSGAGLTDDAKQQMSAIRAQARNRRRADTQRIKRLQTKVQSLEAREAALNATERAAWREKERMEEEKRLEEKRRTDAELAKKREEANQKAIRAAQERAVTWDERYEQLREFRRGHGHARVPTRFPANPGLSRWVKNQRRAYGEKQAGRSVRCLTDERIDRLNELGFAWRTRPEKKGWDERFQELLRYRAENGHCRVSKVDRNNQSLGNWVAQQRKAYKRKDLAFMGERVAKLKEVGFDFTIHAKGFTKTFDERFEQLIAYRTKHGHLPGSKSEDGQSEDGRSKPDGDGVESGGNSGDDDDDANKEEDRRLLNWVYQQQLMYHHQKVGRETSLTTARIKQLESIGFDWNQRKIQLRKQRLAPGQGSRGPIVPWEVRIRQLSEFKSRHGHANPSRIATVESGLGMWLANMKAFHARWQGRDKGPLSATMTPEKFALLENMGVTWYKPSPERIPWEKRFEQLLEFKASRGHTRVPQLWSENKQLASWVTQQRQDRKKRDAGKPSPMSDERIQKLESVGFEFVVGNRKLVYDEDADSSDACSDVEEDVEEEKYNQDLSLMI